MIEVSDDQFKSQVLESEIPVVVDFWASWCGPCKMIAPILDQLSKDLDGKVKIVKINIDHNPNTPSQFGVRGIPTLLIFHKGRQVASKMGLHTKEILQDWIDSSIA
ncbi:MAG: thioredoxin [Rickettsiaceae bacterium]